MESRGKLPKAIALSSVTGRAWVNLERIAGISYLGDTGRGAKGLLRSPCVWIQAARMGSLGGGPTGRVEIGCGFPDLETWSRHVEASGTGDKSAIRTRDRAKSSIPPCPIGCSDPHQPGLGRTLAGERALGRMEGGWSGARIHCEQFWG